MTTTGSPLRPVLSVACCTDVAREVGARSSTNYLRAQWTNLGMVETTATDRTPDTTMAGTQAFGDDQTISSRNLNFWILPDGVVGMASTTTSFSGR